MNEITEFKKLEVQYKLPQITYDLTELTSNVNELEKQYKDFPVNENNLTKAKKITSQINKLSKAINDRKIEVTKEIKSTLTPFESEIKNLVGKIGNLSKGIKAQIDKFTEKEKHEKRMAILQSEYWVDYMVRIYSIIYKLKRQFSRIIVF